MAPNIDCQTFAAMKKQKLPTVANTILIVGFAMGAIAVFVWCLDVNFDGMPDITKRRFGQSGLLLTYCGALFSAHNLFWDDAFAAARSEAQGKLFAVTNKKDLLKKLQIVFPTTSLDKFASAIDEELRRAESDVAVAASQPKLRKISGRAGIVLIVLGTICQFIAFG